MLPIIISMADNNNIIVPLGQIICQYKTMNLVGNTVIPLQLVLSTSITDKVRTSVTELSFQQSEIVTDNNGWGYPITHGITLKLYYM